ncbi:MAG: haloacid dehalogenase-like hydrolase [Candidatus Hydrogenedens sp.]|nr:haloacid dehalogenase-like hydrolase [Candidatus Hydrogenedens sp.]
MSDRPVFSQDIIAIIWDFDKTLTPKYMQQPLFEAFGVDGASFWKEVNALPAYYAQAGIRVNPETCYLGHLLAYVERGRMKGLTNEKLRQLGALIKFYPGVPEIFAELNAVLKQPAFEKWGLELEHYVVSTGLRAMIDGSAVAEYLHGIWACEFIEQPAPPRFPDGVPESGPISQIANTLDNTTKTRAIFEINKGVNKVDGISVNDSIDEEDRRVPIRNMIYIADGPSDVPSFSVIKKHGGIALAVYNPDEPRELKQVNTLRKNGRVDHLSPADYRPESPTTHWLKLQVTEIAERIASEKQHGLAARRGTSPTHLESEGTK